ncbi:MAG: M12 family metallo-peptidase [Ignavibacteria bacterium]|nr:M12 family metallo-peptidase [Ignavibacteria bacterium]
MKRFISILSVVFLSGVLFANELIIDSKFLIKNGVRPTVLNNSEGLVFEINSSVAKEVFTADYEKVRIKDFPLLSSNFVNLTLERAFIPFDQNTEFYKGTKSGLIKTKAPNLMALSGKIDGQPNSFVFLSFTDFGILGTIQQENGLTFTISPNLSQKFSEHILTNANVSVLDEHNIFSCLTEDYAGNSSEAKDLIKFKFDDVPLAKKPLLEVKLACEGTSDFYKIFNNTQNALAYISAVVAHSSKIYQEFFNVRLYIGYAVVWEDEWDDPYYGTKNLSEKLQKMPSVWKNKSIDRALTVLFANLANQPSNETVAGISFGGTPYYGSLCSKDWGYCVLGIRGNASFPTLNYTWDINVATHEIGHNFSLPHTHNCYWQPIMIDTCVTGETYGVGDACIKTGSPIPRPGTIMSYCHLTNSTHSVQLIFHPRELPLARTAAERSNCVRQASSPFISLLNPLGDRTYVAGDNLQIRWTSANVNYLMIFFSSDKGSTWSLIADNVPATDSIFLWQLPNIKTTKGLIYIRDKGNPNVSDTSIKTFSILPKTIQVLSPSHNDEFSVGETIILSWNATLIDTFNVYFSSDGGKTYSTLASNFTMFYYEFVAPELQSDQCKFKITSSDGRIVSESPIFKIGHPIGEITFPKGGEVFCVNAAYTIRWNTSYINKIILEYSTDNGKNWRKVSLGNLDAKIGSYIWKVPNRISNECLVRIRPTFSEQIISTSDSTFSIDSCQVIGGVLNEKSFKNEFIKNVEYNTEDNELSLELTNIEKLISPRLIIVDVLGRTLYSELLNSNTITNNNKTIKLSKVSQGLLFIILNFEGGSNLVSTFIIK